MRRGAYMILAWRPADHDAAARADDLGRRLDGEGGWRLAGRSDRMRLWAVERGRLPARALPHGAGFVVGDLHAMPDAAADASPFSPSGPGVHGPLALARALSRAHWGAYIAVLQGEGHDPTAVFRDPSGELEALTWSLRNGLSVVASEPMQLPSWLRPPRLALNWDRIAGHLAIPSAARLDCLFDGLARIRPGQLSWVSSDRLPATVWHPEDFVAGPGPDLAETAAELVRRVDAVTRDLVAPYSSVLFELSGGLDSAIVAGALANTGLGDRVASWINRYGDRPEGDERVYARAVTDRIGVELTTLPKPLTPLDVSALQELADAMAPAVYGADPARDRDLAERLVATGSHAVVSGQGGDAIFFQMPSALVVADALKREGLSALRSPLLGNVARRTRTPAWRVLQQARSPRGNGDLRPVLGSLVSAEVGALHGDRSDPWLVGADDAPPGKRLQIRALGASQLFRADCRQRRVGDLIHPLLAQPLVELCLSIPTPDLAGADHDRPFARMAFADRIPDSVRLRRGKGNLTSFFARWIAGSADMLRPYLLDGCLCAAGVLDRRRVEQALDPQQLIWAPQAGDLIIAAMTEAWARHWQTRVPDSPAASRASRMEH